MRLIHVIACAALAATGLRAATTPPPSERPRLVVGIVVDQLRTDYLEYLSPLMREGGLPSLMKGGTYLRSVEWDATALDAASATTSLMCGAWPSATGVPAQSVWSPSAMRMLPTMADATTMGLCTTEGYSPAAIRLSTLADELMIDGGGLAQTWSVAATPQMAIALGGHTANGAVWIDPHSGRWASSSYYKELPRAASSANYSRPLSARADTMQWRPLLPMDRYPGLPAQKRYYPFRYTFPTSGRDVYERIASSARGNNLVTDMAIELLRTQSAGTRGDCIDMLTIGYTLAPWREAKDGDYRAETYDAYLQLDRDIERLLSAIRQSVGPQGALIFLLSTGYYDDAVRDDAKYRIPTGTFSVKRAQSLLGAYFTARYGGGSYIQAWNDGCIWLDSSTLEQRGISRSQARTEAKEFLAKMSGVQAVYTADELLSPLTEQARALGLSTDPHSGIDLRVELSPGWTLSEDTSYPVVEKAVRYGRYHTPAIIAGGDAPKGLVIDTPVSAISIAPTISSLLHIRMPNGAGGQSILF